VARTILNTLIAIGLLSAAPFTAPASAQRAVNPYSPALQNSAQRRAILDALRPAVERRLGPGVEFRVDRIRSATAGRW
jgi:hypothetical protein